MPEPTGADPAAEGMVATSVRATVDADGVPRESSTDVMFILGYD